MRTAPHRNDYELEDRSAHHCEGSDPKSGTLTRGEKECRRCESRAPAEMCTEWHLARALPPSLLPRTTSLGVDARRPVSSNGRREPRRSSRWARPRGSGHEARASGWTHAHGTRLSRCARSRISMSSRCRDLWWVAPGDTETGSGAHGRPASLPDLPGGCNKRRARGSGSGSKSFAKPPLPRSCGAART